VAATAEDDDGDGDGDGDDDTAQTQAVATRRPTRTVRITDDPFADVDAGDAEAHSYNGRSGVLDPAAVGARYIVPSRRRGELTRERLIVGGTLLLLFLVLLLIVLGVV
jgi:hypothetical protein